MGNLGHGSVLIPGGRQSENEGAEAGMSLVCSHNRRLVHTGGTEWPRERMKQDGG